MSNINLRKVLKDLNVIRNEFIYLFIYLKELQVLKARNRLNRFKWRSLLNSIYRTCLHDQKVRRIYLRNIKIRL